MPLTHDAFLEAFHEAADLQKAGRLQEALGALKALALAAPDSGQVWHKLGSVLFAMSHFSDAEAALRAALTLRPDTYWANYSLAAMLHHTGRWTEAEPFYRVAMGLLEEPAVRTDFGLLLLGLGNYAEGGPLYESRKDLPGAEERLPDMPEWKGQPIEGRRILIWPEQGYGDQIQFARFAPVLQQTAAEVLLVCPPALYRLFKELPVTVLEHGPNVTLPKPNYWVSPASIPYCLGLNLSDIDPSPYLRAPQEARAKWAGHAPPGSIGYVWRGKSNHNNNQRRSLDGPELMLEVLNRTGAPLFDLTEPVGDFADTAAIIEQLDLVITVDTAVAHLAGALGKPCWVLLPWYSQDWRWLQGRDDSPWYARTRLFRQPSFNGWAPLMQAVAKALAEDGRIRT